MRTRANGHLTGVGLYSLPEAARLLGVRTDKVRRWVLGHERQYRGQRHCDPPVVLGRVASVEGTPIITFTELMELHFVALFRDHGVSLPVIREAARVAARVFGTTHPFAVRRFDTDGKGIFATLERQEAPAEMTHDQFTEELNRSQLVFDEFVKPFFRELDYDDNEIERYWPRGKQARIVIDPRRAFGRPVDAETGVPTHTLYLAARGGANVAGVADWYQVPIVAVEQAVAYEDWLDKAA